MSDLAKRSDENAGPSLPSTNHHHQDSSASMPASVQVIATENGRECISDEGSLAMNHVSPPLLHDQATTRGFDQNSPAMDPQGFAGHPEGDAFEVPHQGIATLGRPPPFSSATSTANPHQSAGGQFLQFGMGNHPGQQSIVMPAYIIAAPQQLQSFGQNPPLEGAANFPPGTQHIVLSIPGNCLPNALPNMGMISYPAAPVTNTTTPSTSTISTGTSATSDGGGNDSQLRCSHEPSALNAYAPAFGQNFFNESGPLLVSFAQGSGQLGAMGRGVVASNRRTSVPRQANPNKVRKKQARDGIPPKDKVVKKSPTDRRYNSSNPVSLVAASRENDQLELSGKGPVMLYLDCDTDSLSEYQCFLRKQIELFEATNDDLQWNAQKMNKGVVLGQVGMRCRYCASQPPWARSRGAVYYSATLDGLYQAGQNMSKNHLSQCTMIPEHIRWELLRLKDGKRRASGGKQYWAEAARAMGVIEDRHGLRFSKEEDKK